MVFGHHARAVREQLRDESDDGATDDAQLAADGDAEPQARDERPFAVSRTEYTEEPDREDVERWTRAYYEDPLIRASIRNFAADVMEPGLAAAVETEDGESMPTVPSDYGDPAYAGMDLDDALEQWAAQAAIIGGEFDRSLAALMEDVIIDVRGRRGSAIAEHAYDDPIERDHLLGVRLFKTETVTAYTREGKAILLRPDDDADGEGFETVAIQNVGGDFDLNGAPTTPAGVTAAWVQYDDIFGRFQERDDIPLALDDTTFLSNDPDTGGLFGRPDTASVVDESEDLREELSVMADAAKTTAFGNWVADVNTDDPDEAKDLLTGLDPSDGDAPISVINFGLDNVEEVFGEFPDLTDAIQQQIEYILAALPTPLYRVGFAGDINRDVTTEQRADYRDEIRRERNRLESAFTDLFRQKAADFLTDDCKNTDAEVVPEVRPVIKPEDTDNPLEDEAVDPDEFASLMQGVKAAAPGGATEQIVPPHEVRETFLGLDPEPPEAPEGTERGPPPLPDETDERVQAAFEEAYDDAALGTRYAEGDEVETPSGRGVVVDVFESDDTFADTAIKATESSPTYIVATEGGRPAWEKYKASDLTATTIKVEGVEPVDAAAEAEAMADLAAATTADEGPDGAKLGVTDWDYPESWEQSETPNRVILLKAWAGMGGSFDGCQREMRGEIGRTAPFCASMKDRVLLTEQWRS